MTFQERFKGKLNYIRKDGVKGVIRDTDSRAEKPNTRWASGSISLMAVHQTETLETYENEFI